MIVPWGYLAWQKIIQTILSTIIFSFSKLHQNFDPFEEQKKTSFIELQNSAISLAQFLCQTLDATLVDHKGNVKTLFDIFLQVC